MKQLAGVTATGKLGEKPKVSMHTPMTVENNTYAILQKGDGATVEDGDRVCVQGIALNANDGTELMDTWAKNTPDCSLVINKTSTNSSYYSVIKGQKINTSIAFGVNDPNAAQSGATSSSYIMVLTIISKEKSISRATGDKVTDIPSDLPKVTLAANGEPSLDLNGYKPDGKLVAQTLIKGKGKAVSATSALTVNYSGWVADKDGKLSQFDSSWPRNTPFDFTMGNGVITGWTNGLAGQTVGSQVLLIIPPDQGYGNSTSNSKIPANSTLYFVVDILYAA